jgi:hypothetical protein
VMSDRWRIIRPHDRGGDQDHDCAHESDRNVHNHPLTYIGTVFPIAGQ